MYLSANCVIRKIATVIKDARLKTLGLVKVTRIESSRCANSRSARLTVPQEKKMWLRINLRKKLPCLLARCESAFVISERAGGNDTRAVSHCAIYGNARPSRVRNADACVPRGGIELHSLPRLSIRFSLVKSRYLIAGRRKPHGTHRRRVTVNHGNHPRACEPKFLKYVVRLYQSLFLEVARKYSMILISVNETQTDGKP